MTPVRIAAHRLVAAIAKTSARVGRQVHLDAEAVLDRRDSLALARPGRRSANRSCRLVRTADGWIAVNLPRASDVELVPAWLERPVGGDPWTAIERSARRALCGGLLERAHRLGLAAAAVGEVAATGLSPSQLRLGRPSPRQESPEVVDLSALWAGPLCGSVLAAAGARVTKIECRRRPDAMQAAGLPLYRRLNGAKRHERVDLTDPSDVARLGDRLAKADMVITSARPRAFEQLGLAPAQLFARNPSLIWVAITAYGWAGAGAGRIGFGDDAAAAGGLVRPTHSSAPRFIGDAVADPLTGLAAGAAALEAWRSGGGVLIDAALARVAAGAAGQR